MKLKIAQISLQRQLKICLIKLFEKEELTYEIKM